MEESAFPAAASFVESLRLYFETYGDPTDFRRSQMISFAMRGGSLTAGEGAGGEGGADAAEGGQV